MRIKQPSFKSKKDLFQYLTENKKDLVKQKKNLPIKSSDPKLDDSMYSFYEKGNTLLM